MINIIKSWLREVTYIPINGNKMPEFSPSRGIKQGDPLSPYIFILAMESSQISSVLNLPKKNGPLISSQNIKFLYKFPKNKIPISHILFADDILIFCKATQQNFMAVQETLHTFSALSGLNITLDKSRIWTSKNINDQTKNYIHNNIKIRISNDLGFYLGFPLKHSYKHNDFNFILEKIKNKFQGWKQNLLSKAERVELINSTITNISNYYMKPFLLPKMLIDKMEKKTCDFFWGSTSDVLKFHTLKWNEIAKPKKLGGLVIKNLAIRNKGILIGQL